jgi:hypothetical protein
MLRLASESQSKFLVCDLFTILEFAIRNLVHDVVIADYHIKLGVGLYLNSIPNLSKVPIKRRFLAQNHPSTSWTPPFDALPHHQR